MKIETRSGMPNWVKVVSVTIEEGDFDNRFSKASLNKVGEHIAKTFKCTLWSFGFDEKRKEVYFKFKDGTKTYPLTIDFEEYYAYLTKLNKRGKK